MHKTCQIICYVFSWFAVRFLGGLFDTAFGKISLLKQQVWGGMPLPVITEFFGAHRHLAAPLLLLPWLAFVGLPLVSSPATRDYWQPTGFFLRLAALLSAEGCLLLLYVFAVTSALPGSNPFVSYFGRLETRAETWPEWASDWVVWAVILLMVAAATLRWWQQRRSHPA